jgi:hypothetical protein
MLVAHRFPAAWSKLYKIRRNLLQTKVRKKE